MMDEVYGSMTVTEQTRDNLTESLYTALQEGDPIDQLTATHDLTIEDAYDIQTRFIERRIDHRC